MKLNCPVNTCQAENDAEAEVCSRCGTPFSGFAQLSTYPAHLFNQGLSAAREGQMSRARDLFSAVVYWCPTDREARNALGMACLALGDQPEARHHWETVLNRFPKDPIATQGIATLDSEPEHGKEKASTILEDIKSQLKEIQQNQEKHGLQLTEALQSPLSPKTATEESNQEIIATRLQNIEKRWNKKFIIGGILAFLILAISIFTTQQMVKINDRIKHTQDMGQMFSDEYIKQSSAKQTDKIDHESVHLKVKEAIQTDGRINWLNLDVQQESEGNIRLRGEVYTNYLKSLVEKVVGNIEGVNLIDSREVKIISSYKTQNHDTFWKIAKRVYGDGTKWEKIYRSNQEKTPDPNAIQESTMIFIPND